MLNALGLMGPPRMKVDLSNRVLPIRPCPVTPPLGFCELRCPRYLKRALASLRSYITTRPALKTPSITEGFWGQIFYGGKHADNHTM